MSYSLSRFGRRAIRMLPVARNALFKISRRQVHFQDVLFGMENERNLLRMIRDEKSGGPSMIMNAGAYGIPISFITDKNSIHGNDDTSRVFGLNPLDTSPNKYSEFPLAVHKMVQKRRGLFEVSFQYDDQIGQWNPDRLLEYLGENDVSSLRNIETHTLFDSFLKKRNATEGEIASMYAATLRKNLRASKDSETIKFLKNAFEDNDPKKNLRSERIQEFCERVAKSDENFLSFTDIEFGIFFLYLHPSERYNMACSLQGGHLIKTEEVAARLQELLELKRAKNGKQYAQKLSDFMAATRGDTGTVPRSEKIVSSFRELPLFDLIFQQNSDFMARNFAALCVKIDAYLLNLVKPGEKLVVILQFQYVFFDGAPYIKPLLLSLDEDKNVKVEELFSQTDDPLSLAAKTVDSRLAKSIKYCGTPSANICILENPKEMEAKFTEASKSLWALNKNVTSDSEIFINRVNCLIAAFTHPEVKLRFLNGQPLKICSQTGEWNDVLKVFDSIGFMTSKFRMKDNPPEKEWVESSFFMMDSFNKESDERVDQGAAENYEWQPVQTFELSEKFEIAKAQTANNLPSGFREPVAYPEHIGAAAPFNSSNETGQLMTEKTFKELTEND